MTSCRKCGGTGIVKYSAEVPQRCPVCMAAVWTGAPFSIEWDDNQKEFDVVLTFERYSQADVRLIATLPNLIQAESRCSCGGLLRVRNHAFRTTKDGIIFTGSFVCSTCKGANRPLLSKLRDGVLAIWNGLRRVKIGPVEIEKNRQG
jgi:hypothetical protein